MRRDRREGASFLTRPIEGDWPYVWLDATYVKARRDGHIVSVAVIIAAWLGWSVPATGTVVL